MRALKESFNAGEFTPKLHSRYQLAKYKNGCKELTNFIPTPHGPVVRRPGTEYIAETKNSLDIYCRLIPFVFSNTDAYILEFGPLYIRFYRDGGQIQDTGGEQILLHFDGTNNSTTITDDGDTGHTCTAEGNAKLRTDQKVFGSASCHFDGIDSFISVPDHADWNFGNSNFTIDCWVRWDSVSDSTGIYSQRDDSSNTVKLLWSNAGYLQFNAFNAGDEIIDLRYTFTPTVDTWYHIAVVRGWGGSSDSFALCVDGSAEDTGSYDETETMPDLAADAEIGRGVPVGTAAYHNGYIDEFRITKAAAWTANFSVPETAYPFGDDSGTVYEVVTTYIEEDLAGLYFVQSADTMFIVHENYVPRKLVRSGHASWAISDVSFTDIPAAWSASDYPRTVELYEDRLCFGGSPDQPDTIWTSESGSYTVFSPGTAQDDEAITLTLGATQVNSIKWLSGSRRLLAGTGGEEWWLSGPSDNEPITPTDNLARRDSSLGSARIMPVNIGDKIFFVQRGGKIIREISYDFSTDKYVSTDLTLLAEHLTKTTKIVSIAYQQHPYQTLWCVLEDGKFLSLTYMKEHDVIGWAYHESTLAWFDSVAVVPGEIEDEVWFTVRRFINDTTRTNVERLSPFFYGTSLRDARYSDSSLKYYGGDVTSVTGLSHLEGEAVAVLADGVSVTGKTVSSGSITLDTAAGKIMVGLPYTSTLETLDAVAEDERGVMQGLLKRVQGVSISLVDSMGGSYGPDADNTQEIPYDSETAVFTGWTDDLAFPEGFDKTSTVYITTSEPMPLEIAAILIDLED